MNLLADFLILASTPHINQLQQQIEELKKAYMKPRKLTAKEKRELR